MSKKKSNEIVEYWNERVQNACEYAKKHSTMDRWKDYRNYYRGEWQKDVIPLNVTFSSGRTIVPRSYFRNPRVMVKPTHPDLETAARILEEIDNWLIRETMLKQTMRGSVLTTFLNGIGPIKLGFDSEFGFIPEQAMDESGETVTQVSTEQARYIEYNASIKPGMPWALPELPENVIMPPGYKYPNQLPWIGHRVLRPLADVISDQKYTIDKRKPLQGTRVNDISLPAHLIKSGLHKDMQLCELIEIRDKAHRNLMVFCEDQLILSDQDALQIDGLPWEFIVFNEDPEFIWGIPDVKMIEAQQLEVNEIKSQIQAHRAIALLKFLALKGALKPFDIKGLLSGDVGPYVEVEAESLAAALQILQPHIPPDLNTAAREVLADIQETLRISANQMAAFKAGTPPTAQETAEVSGSHAEDVDDRRDIVGDVLVNIIRKWNQFIFTQWKTERVVQITGPEGREWIQYTGDQIRGEYHYVVDVDTGFKVSRQVRMSAADKLFAQFGGDDTLDTMEFKEMVLREYEWIFPGISRLVKEQLPPEILDAMSANRQPNPAGAGGGQGGQRPPMGPAAGNRGGGRVPGEVKPMEQAKKENK